MSKKIMTDQKFLAWFMTIAALVVFTCFLTAALSLWGVLIIDDMLANLNDTVEGISVIP